MCLVAGPTKCPISLLTLLPSFKWSRGSWAGWYPRQGSVPQCGRAGAGSDLRASRQGCTCPNSSKRKGQPLTQEVSWGNSVLELVPRTMDTGKAQRLRLLGMACGRLSNNSRMDRRCSE